MKVLSIDVGIRNLAYCLFEVSETSYKDVDELIGNIHVIDWAVISLTGDTKKKADRVSLITIGRTMTDEFNTRFGCHKIDTVLIENQISPIANRMKTIQGMITQYFVMSNVPSIEYVSASNKLKLFISKKTTYNERKKLGIEVMNTQVLEKLDAGKWKTEFNTHKKKDDLADSFLQSLYYLHKNT